MSYRGKTVTGADIAFIRKMVADHPGESRRQLSKRFCLAWNWVQANGALRDQVCRSLLLVLERACAFGKRVRAIFFAGTARAPMGRYERTGRMAGLWGI